MWLVISIIIFLDHSSFHTCAVKAFTHTRYRKKKFNIKNCIFLKPGIHLSTRQAKECQICLVLPKIASCVQLARACSSSDLLFHCDIHICRNLLAYRQNYKLCVYIAHTLRYARLCLTYTCRQPVDWATQCMRQAELFAAVQCVIYTNVQRYILCALACLVLRYILSFISIKLIKFYYIITPGPFKKEVIFLEKKRKIEKGPEKSAY